MSGIVQFHACNTSGRDFVVGDIHGCYSDLRRVLDREHFDPGNDRLFSVGDLIDRGPQSIEALEWLAKPWFHACIGNHEEMLLNAPHDENIRLNWVMFNGGDWWMKLDGETRREFRDALLRLPIAMEIETAHGHVGIVHADIPEGLTWQAFIAGLASGNSDIREITLWGRARADGTVSTPVAGIDCVVCGHTITPDREVHRYANVWFIDTGAFLSNTVGGHLTLLALDSLFENAGADGLPP